MSKHKLLALDADDIELMCPLSGVEVSGRKILPHIITVVRVCYRTQKKLPSIFACCPIHNITMFLNNQPIVEELIHGSLENPPLPPRTAAV